jgi:hypothetical protein
MLSIWGNSSTDIWVVGDNENLSANIFHYDGARWSPFPAISGRPYRVSYASVFGFSANNVYAVGLRGYYNPRPGVLYEDSSFIAHFNGTSWNVESVPPGRGLLRVWGSSPNNIWAAGDYGTLLHFDGQAWTKVPFDSLQSIGPIFGTGSGNTFCISSLYDFATNPDTAYYYFNEYAGNQWYRRTTMAVTNDLTAYGFGHYGLWGTSPNRLYSFGNKLYMWNGLNWEFMFGDSYILYDMRGSSDTNIFLVGDHGMIYHFDGIHWTQLKEYRSTIVTFVSVVVFESEVFILANYGNRSYVVHGRLMQ